MTIRPGPEQAVNMLSRISEAIRAKMNDILDNAENPYETFGYAFEKVVESLRDTHALIADVTETKQRLHSRHPQ